MAQEVKLPLNAVPDQNVDEISIGFDANVGGSFFDGYFNENGDIIKRPGLGNPFNLSTNGAINGMFWWDDQFQAVFVSQGRVFKREFDGGPVTEILGASLELNTRPTFAQNGNFLVCCNGGRLISTNGAVSDTITDPFAPTAATHLAQISGFLLAFELGTSIIKFTDFNLVNPLNNWQERRFFSAEANPDKVIIAMTGNNKILSTFSSSSTEFHLFNGITFARINFKTLNSGIMAPYAYVVTDLGIFFFDDQRRLRRLNGTQVFNLSNKFDRLISRFNIVDDCTIDYVIKDLKRWLVINFPSQNRTLFYDIQLDYWAELSELIESTGTRSRFLGGSYIYAKGFNKHYFGNYKNSIIYEFDEKFTSDDGNNIGLSKEILNSTHGTYLEKQCKAVRFSALSGTGKGPDLQEKSVALLEWKESSDDNYTSSMKIDLGKIGQNNPLKVLDNLGSYRSRDWRLTHTDQTRFVLSDSREYLEFGDI